jgi:hypothetical protein
VLLSGKKYELTADYPKIMFYFVDENNPFEIGGVKSYW